LDLVTYRTALEQLRAGRPQNAQLLLETSGAAETMAPENALLLAYLEDEKGQREQARSTLSVVENPSPIIDAYLSRLGGPTAESIAARQKRNGARLTKLEAYMLDLVNDTREKQGLSRLQNDPRLAEVARAHSAEMRDKQYFAHDSPTPSLREPLDRYVAGFGTKPHIIAENIYRVYGGRSFLTQKDTQDAHVALMNSPHHRENLLDPRVTRIGIGFATNATGDLWLTQMFSQPF
jgi:uncharacterized protein YkwD